MPQITKIELNIGLEAGRSDGEARAYNTPDEINVRAIYCVNTATDYLNASMITGLNIYDNGDEAGVAVAYDIAYNDEDALIATIDKLCSLLGQEAIAVRYHAIYNKQGEPRHRWREKLVGPRAAEWGSFNAAFWVKP